MNSLGTLDWGRFLSRPRLPSPSMEVLDALYRQSILISGAGGSVGAALAQRFGILGPSALLLVDSSEGRLYKLQQDWIANGVPGSMTPILGNVTDRTLLDEVFAVRRPTLVFHTAAFKHVPLLEDQPMAAIANNIFGTLILTRVAEAHGARIVLLSSDKAVQPTSVRGATNAISERIVLGSNGTVVRIGNVLGTRDSVTETFARQIASGKPLTVTSPAARRYFLTLEEAVNLLLIAAAEPDLPALLVPELPAPQFVTDLARFMADTLMPGQLPEIDFIGLRPGDKDEERFWSTNESPRPAVQPGLLKIPTSFISTSLLDESLGELFNSVEARDLVGTLHHLQSLVPDYIPSPTIRALAEHRVSS